MNNHEFIKPIIKAIQGIDVRLTTLESIGDTTK